MAKFQKGQSGNPKGRPRASGGVEDVREALKKQVPAILNKLIERVRDDGDVTAAKLLLERCFPPLKVLEPPISLPAMAKAATLAEQGEVVIKAAGAGEISPSQASALLGALAAQARLIESTELQERLDAVEARLGGKP